MTRIKLCGLTRMEDISFVNSFLPDYIGFVFYKKSSRYIDPDQAFVLRENLHSSICPVGVFVNEDIFRVAEAAEKGVIGAIQLHGNEDENYISELKSRVNCPVIKAFGIKHEADLEAALASSADFILFDHIRGGSGIRFDWNLVRDFKRDFFLAGGLEPEGVGKAVRKLHPFAVDVSSGIETDGKKDPLKIGLFISAVRSADKKTIRNEVPHHDK